jgi:hypothetical protein
MVKCGVLFEVRTESLNTLYYLDEIRLQKVKPLIFPVSGFALSYIANEDRLNNRLRYIRIQSVPQR